MGLKLFSFRADPPHSQYCSGGGGVVAANTPEEALGLVMEARLEPYGHYDHETKRMVYELPEEIVLPEKVGVVFYEGVTE